MVQRSCDLANVPSDNQQPGLSDNIALMLYVCAYSFIPHLIPNRREGISERAA